MKIQLERLPHQVAAVKAIDKEFAGVDEYSQDPDANYIYANPILKGAYNEQDYIDIKMETGTGKTFVYTQMMYEMHKQGIFKFVIVVPTPSIKEGTKNFITSDYARQYFSGIPGYENVTIQLNEINAGDFRARKSGRKNFPAQLSEFIEATRQNVNQIQVLLINSGMLSKNSGMHKSDYDQTLLGGETNPIKAIAATRPVIIIDEPHRFSRDKVTYKSIEEMKPQLIVRYGATFPQITSGKGKNKIIKTDYYRGKPQYNLNAIDSFNQGLVKWVDIYYPEITEEQANNRYKIKSAVAKKLTLTKHGSSKEYELERGQSLSSIDEDFSGDIIYNADGGKTFSNGLEAKPGMELIPGTFSESYQDDIIAQAIDCHFKAEEANFMRHDSSYTAPKVKTLSLFFIDDIRSFRGNDGHKGWLAEHFEKLLTKKLTTLIKKYEMSINDREREYLSFLKATLHDLQADEQSVYAGYFSEDRGSGDEAIQAEVDDILVNKEKLLSFKDKAGNWITRRFLFSKWTLREGWDNPNVFVIAKLRTSGSEISKIQEVGRGLRLPVDEFGHRLSQTEFPSRLSFLIGYDEKDFAHKLVGEINSQAEIKLDHKKLTDEMINETVKLRQKDDSSFTEDALLNDLDQHGVITRSNDFCDSVELNGQTMSGYDAFLELYPELKNKIKVGADKVRDQNKRSTPVTVKLRKTSWHEFKDLWLELSKRKMIMIEDAQLLNQAAETAAKDVFSDHDREYFVLYKMQMNKSEVVVNKEAIIRDSKTNPDYDVKSHRMPYGKFLKNLALETDLSISFLHEQMIAAMARLDNNTDYINEKTLGNLISEITTRINNQVKNNYKYVSLDFTAPTSVYDPITDEFVDAVAANSIGVNSSDSVVADKRYLYDRPPVNYDSVHPELDILKQDYQDVIAYGKLPKNAIRIPRYQGGTTTPDFIFKVKGADGEVRYLVVEAKAENMRIDDKDITETQQKYFDKLAEITESNEVHYVVATKEQDVHTAIDKMRE